MHASTDDPLAALDLWLDDSLSASEAAALERRVERDPQLEKEKRRLEFLHALLAQDRVEVLPGLADAVMERLPQRGPNSLSKGRAWAVAVAALLAGGAAVTAVLSWGEAGAGGSGVLAPLAAVGDFFATVLLAGAGLLAASWRGLGQLVSLWLGASAANLILGALVVLGVNLLLISLLRRRYLGRRYLGRRYLGRRSLAAQRVKGDRDHE